MQFKKGDEIICVDNEGCGKSKSLTVGKSYIVSGISSFEDLNYVRIKNNHWQYEDYFSSRFVFKTQQNINRAQILKMFNDICNYLIINTIHLG